MESMKSKNPVDHEVTSPLAAIWSMMLPGLGQMMKSRPMAGLIWAFVVAAGYYAYFWPGLVIHGLCILDAALYEGKGSFVSFETWPKRIGFLVLIVALGVYIYYRNTLTF
jgi:TM2 domain-containing membrane protein YozV